MNIVKTLLKCFLIKQKNTNMKSMENLFKYIIIIATKTIIFFTYSKKKSSDNSTVPSGKQALSLYLTDGPTDYFDKVLIDIKSVKVLVDTCDRNHRRQNN